MYTSSIVLALVSAVSASVMPAEFAVAGNALAARSVQQGWSLYASSAPSGAVDCGNNMYCPSGTSCNAAATNEVAACCTCTLTPCPLISILEGTTADKPNPAGDCRGAVEGAPSCADSTWNLWKGLDGNGFCCETGKVGVFDYKTRIAGTCIDSGAAAPAGAANAVLMSTAGAAGASGPRTVKVTATATTTVKPNVLATASGVIATASGAVSSVAANAVASATSAAGNVVSGVVNAASSVASSALAAATAKSPADNLRVGLGAVAAGALAVLAL
jgi:glucan endo-1,3-alpha-glucosidase